MAAAASSATISTSSPAIPRPSPGLQVPAQSAPHRVAMRSIVPGSTGGTGHAVAVVDGLAEPRHAQPARPTPAPSIRSALGTTSGADRSPRYTGHQFFGGHIAIGCSTITCAAPVSTGPHQLVGAQSAAGVTASGPVSRRAGALPRPGGWRHRRDRQRRGPASSHRPAVLVPNQRRDHDPANSPTANPASTAAPASSGVDVCR